MSTSSDDMAVLDRLAEDFVGKLRHGERPLIRPYVDQNPHLATESIDYRLATVKGTSEREKE